MTEFFTEQYDVLVTYGPFVTILGFFGFYGIMIYLVHKNGQGTVFNRISFSLLFMALLPNFFAHLSLAIVHGAWSPFLAEVVNIAPVIYYIAANEYYYRKHDGMTRVEYNAFSHRVHCFNVK